jgi:hypothetical protein
VSHICQQEFYFKKSVSELKLDVLNAPRRDGTTIGGHQGRS